MSKRAKFGALAGALLFTFAVASSAMAAAPTYSITVAKTASPTTVAAAGTTVLFTVWVTNNGTGFFGAVSATDDHCTLDGPFGDQDKGQGAGKLEAGETWSFTCSYAVGSAQTNTATVNACHDGSVDQCNNATHDATGTASASVTVAAATVTTPAAPNTSTTAPVSSSSADGAWLLIIALGILLASVVILTPARSKSRG